MGTKKKPVETKSAPSNVKDSSYVEPMLEALRCKYESDMQIARANLIVYLTNPAGIGEHSDVMAALDEQIGQLATAEEKLFAVSKLEESF